ncbi:MAG TPA: chromate efflux transporter, partial [Burkholderiaceae bacterium]|nr:chromate efflux transporter [Burkholderiaceae bacterium]
PGLLHGLKIVAVAVVAQAVWGMARKLCVGLARIAITAISTCVVLQWPTALGQVGVILMAALAGVILFKPVRDIAHDSLPITLSRRVGSVLLIVFFALLIGLPIALQVWPNRSLELSNAFYRAGSLVFGGGHVMLPLLQSAVVPSGWVTNDAFLAGYGVAQALPGPLSTFAAFLGASMNSPPNGWIGASLCLVAIFLPSFLLVFGALPFWEQLRRSAHTQTALAGVNAAVVGLLLAALYHPVWTSAILKPTDFVLAMLALLALMYWKLPPWLVVLSSGAVGWLLSAAL